MVPAAVELIGDKIWWPSTAQGGAQLGESYEAEAAQQGAGSPPPPPGLALHRPLHSGLRFSPKALMPSRMSSEAKLDSRRAISSRSSSGVIRS